MGTVVHAKAAIAGPCPRPTARASTRCRSLVSRRGVRAIRQPRFHSPAVTATKSDVSTGIFPAGKQQAKVQLPAVFVVLTSQEALAPELSQLVEKCISAGATALIVRDSSTGGADLFNATAQVKEAVRGRVAILVEDRTDIVAASAADGVVLTSQGMADDHVQNTMSSPGFSLAHHLRLRDWQLAMAVVARQRPVVNQDSTH